MTLSTTELTVPGRLCRVSVALRPGEVTAILGPNGAGKSTLLAALAGLGEGPVSLDGTLLAGLPARDRARAIGYLPQSGEVAWDITVETLAALGRLQHRSAPAEDRAAIEAALAALDLLALRARPLSQLSGGERARALLARVLAGTPRWVLADEPLASLDLAHEQALLACFRGLAQQGLGVVLVLHNLAAAMNRADRVIVLDQGSVVADGPPQEVLTPALIEQVWSLQSQWLGSDGARALAY